MGRTLSPTQRVYLYASTVAVAGFLFGFDTGTIGAITTMAEFERQFGVLSDFMRGVVVAIILVPSAVSGVFAGAVSDRISRKRTISLGSAIFAVGSAVTCGSGTLGVLIFGRCLAGVGEGFFLSCMTVYVSEISPAPIRGTTALITQVGTSSAIAVGYFLCYGSVKIDSSLSWRLPFAVATFLALVLAVTAPMLPYSPRWLVSKGRRDEAERVLDLIAPMGDADERRELLSLAERPAKCKSFGDIFAKGVRGRTILGVFLNVANQLTGIDFVLFFAPLLFTQAGLDASTSSFVASGVTGLLILASTLISYAYIDRVGRRTIWLVGGTAIALCHFTIGSLYASGAAHDRIGKWVVVVVIELFALSFSLTWSSIIRVYTSEIQPNETRAAATSFGQGMNQAVNFVVAVTGPGFLSKSAYGPYFTYGSFTAFAVIMSYLYMPETIGKTLETIDFGFEGSPYVVKWPQALLSGRSRILRHRGRGVGRVEGNMDERRPCSPDGMGWGELGMRQ